MISELEKIVATYKEHYSDDRLVEDDTRTKLIDEILHMVLEWDEPSIERQRSVEGERSIKHADYAYPKSAPKVIVEAKRLNTDKNLAQGKYDKQVQDYAYSKAVNWAILTDFKRIRGWYVTRDNIYPFCDIDLIDGNLSYAVEKLALLNRYSILDGSLDEYAKVSQYKVQEIDITSDLSNSINKFRERMSRYLKTEHKDVNDPEKQEELIQGLINRLIFIKKVEAEELEERKIEQIYRKGGKDVYAEIKTVFAYYREKYDTDIFGKPDVKSDLELIDIPDKVITELLDHISKPSPKLEYNFAAIDVDVLGGIYENYLAFIQKGKKLTGGKSKRKEQGIYYTPKEIVDYIVDNTVGEYLRSEDLKAVKNLKIVDPACGSGSFLISTVSELNGFYERTVKNYKVLSPSEKLELIKKNIYGVDLDERAVSIAKLNVYLKILSSTKQKAVGGHTTLLPELKTNIKVGNSIIGDDELADGKALNWEAWLNRELDDKHFGIVVGNPPYGADLTKPQSKYILKTYPATKNNTDTAIAFINKSMLLLDKNGYLGYIVPKPLIYSQKWQAARNLIKNDLVKLVDVSKAFKDVLLEQVIIIVKKGSNSKEYYIDFLNNKKQKVKIDKGLIDVFGNFINDVSEEELQLGLKLVKDKKFISDVADIERGIIIQDRLKETGDIPIIRGKCIERYHLNSALDFIDKSDYKTIKDEASYLEKPKIVVQNIVAHVLKPKDHIVMMAAIDTDGKITLDNVGNIFVKNDIAPEFIVALLNSKLINWYVYRFIYAKAIRTMRFDKYHLAKVPLCSYSGRNEYEKIVRLVKEMSNKEIGESRKDNIKSEINMLIYDLYKLSNAEVRLVEANSW